MPDTFRLRAHGSHMPLCDLNLCNMHSSPCITGFIRAHTCSRFCLVLMPLGASYLWCQIEWHHVQSTQASRCLGQTKPLCAWLVFSSSPGGGGTTSLPATKKKKRRDEDASTPDQFGLLYLWFAPPKKKNTHMRDAPAVRFTVGNGRTRFYFLAELYLLFMMD